VHSRLLAVPAALALQVLPAARAATSAYGIVILQARAIDPETGLDAIRNIGIIADKVTAISTEPLAGKRR
jgi:dihydroorotase